MDAPRKDNEQVADASVDTGSLLEKEFDRMASEDTPTGEALNEETISAEDVSQEENVSQEVVEAQEDSPESVDEEQGASAAAADVASAEESGYKEPAPERWPEDMRDYYDKLEPEGKKMMMENVYKPMQRQYTQSTQELSAMRKTLDPMIQSVNQYQNDFERMGVNPQEAFQTQVAWAAHFARVGPQQGISDMRDAYGLNKDDQGGQTAEQYLTPTERQMKTEIDGLKQQVAQTSRQSQGFQEQQQQTAQSNYVAGVRNELQSFINEQKDGKPAHPHVEKVAPAIAGIIRGGLIKKQDEYGQAIPIAAQMEQAYNMAVKLDPSISTAKTTTRQVQSAKNAQEADVVANNPSGQSNVPKLSMSEQIEENYDALKRRVG